MSKREDSFYIKTISKTLPIVKEWTKVPLFVLDKGTHIEQIAKEKQLNMGKTEQDFATLMEDIQTYAPTANFLFMDKAIEIQGDALLKHNYFYVSMQDKHQGIDILYPTYVDKLMWFALMKDKEGEWQARVLQAQGTLGEMWSVEEINAGKFEYIGTSNLKDIQAFLSTITVRLGCVLQALGESDLYAVETKGKQHRKVHAKKPWQRADLASIIYLNRLPSEQRKSLGGHHNSPHPHPRNGTWRRLDSERYKNHPKYKDRIWIKPTWVGPKESTVNSVTYKVL